MAFSDLSERIKLINHMNNATAKEEAAEKTMVEAVESQDSRNEVVTEPEDLDELAAVAEDMMKEEVPTTSEQFQEILDAIAELKAEITKMNKHVNSIQKFIKKGK